MCFRLKVGVRDKSLWKVNCLKQSELWLKLIPLSWMHRIYPLLPASRCSSLSFLPLRCPPWRKSIPFPKDAAPNIVSSAPRILLAATGRISLSDIGLFCSALCSAGTTATGAHDPCLYSPTRSLSLSPRTLAESIPVAVSLFSLPVSCIGISSPISCGTLCRTPHGLLCRIPLASSSSHPFCLYLTTFFPLC